MVIFYDMIKFESEYCILDLSKIEKKENIPEEFKKLKDDIEPNKDINIIICST